MNRKKLFGRLILSMFCAGIIITMIPFCKTMNPKTNEKISASLPRIDISKIKNGEMSIQKIPDYGFAFKEYEWSVLIYKKHNGTIHVWNIPVKNGSVGMPDLQWWRPFYECKSFGPTVINGVVDESKPIKCHDTTLPSEWWSEQWRWDIDGKNLGGQVNDLEKAYGEINGNYFVSKRHS